MGRGNWRPYQDSELYDLRYFDLYERFGIEPGAMESWDWDMFVDEILMALPDSFLDCSDERVSVPYTNFASDNSILFRNELVCIMIDAQANADHVGVAMVLLESDDEYSGQTFVGNFAPRYLERCAPKFWERMGGEQSVRTSAWTSAKID